MTYADENPSASATPAEPPKLSDSEKAALKQEIADLEAKLEEAKAKLAADPTARDDYQHFPKLCHNKQTGGSVIVQNQAELDKLGADWE